MGRVKDMFYTGTQLEIDDELHPHPEPDYLGEDEPEVENEHESEDEIFCTNVDVETDENGLPF